MHTKFYGQAQKKDYRGNHIATAILKTAINKRQDKTKPVICTCLRLKNKKINLYSIVNCLDVNDQACNYPVV